MQHYALCFLLISIVNSQTLTVADTSALQLKPQTTVLMTIVSDVLLQVKPQIILSSLALPGYSRKHGFNHVALDGWTCSRGLSSAIRVWSLPNSHIGTILGQSNQKSRESLRNIYKSQNINLLVNAFGKNEDPIYSKIDPVQCADKLVDFVNQNNLDGFNLDFNSSSALKTAEGITWMTSFMLHIRNSNFKKIVAHMIDAQLFDASKYPQGNYLTLNRAVGDSISFYNVKYQGKTYQNIFSSRPVSVQALSNAGIPLNKIVVAKAGSDVQQSYVKPETLLNFCRQANRDMNWTAGVTFYPFIRHQTQDQTSSFTFRRDHIDTINSVYMDSVNSWWPPEKTAGDIGVPGYAPNNMYNHMIFGTWTCRNGAFDISKLWSQASFFLGDKFGKTTQEIQRFLKARYESKGKKILVKAFGTGQSPTTGMIDAVKCAQALAGFVKSNNLDGVDVSYQDNQSFNAGRAQQWLIAFTNTLRSHLPFHLVVHSIQNYYLNSNRYASGGYKRVIRAIGSLLDFYQIVYFGQQQSTFSTHQQMFINSGNEIPNIAVAQLLSDGFQLDKIVISKPIRLFDAQGQGFVQPLTLRNIFLEAHSRMKWRTGICYSSYIQDQDGRQLMLLLRGIDKSQSIRFAYVGNVNKWWPPKDTLAQMGVPTLAAKSIYNYYAYAFWTCHKGPQAITSVYHDPIKFLGTQLGKTKQQIQTYIYDLYKANNVKLMISSFGATQQPVKEGLDASQCGRKFVDFIRQNRLDGVDVDYQDSGSFRNGTGQKWNRIFMRQIRKQFPFIIVTHAPQAPYFSPFFGPKGSYLTIDRQVGKHIDFYNIQFYNQLNTTYDTYQNLFIDSGPINPKTAVYQIIAQGIEAEKVVVGKPAKPQDAYNTGFVQGKNLQNIFRQAVKDSKNPGWKPHVMFWQYLSDLDSKMIGEAMAFK